VDFLEFWDIASGLMKGAVFGFLVATHGLLLRHAFGAAARSGVGRATTKAAVVSASMLILAANYILTEVFFSA
jgi:phospholipid/cholesterol/gamma-HCH transport system permease protein